MTKTPVYLREEEGARLRAAFLRLKRTQGLVEADIARRCGWKSPSTLSRLLTGKREVTPQTLTRVCAALNVSPSFVSPRLVPSDPVAGPAFKRLPVAVITSIKDAAWSDVETGSLVLLHNTDDPGARALAFSADLGPACFQGWVLALEPYAIPQPGNWVVVDLAQRMSTCAVVLNVDDSGAIALRRWDGLEMSAKSTKCAVVTHLARRQMLEDSAHARIACD